MIEIGKTYTAKNGNKYKCITVIGDAAWCHSGSTEAAYVWNAETGQSKSLSPEYDLKLDAPKTPYAVAADQVADALRDCIAVMENDLHGLRMIQPELSRAVAALAAWEAAQ